MTVKLTVFPSVSSFVSNMRKTARQLLIPRPVVRKACTQNIAGYCPLKSNFVRLGRRTKVMHYCLMHKNVTISKGHVLFLHSFTHPHHIHIYLQYTLTNMVPTNQVRDTCIVEALPQDGTAKKTKEGYCTHVRTSSQEVRQDKEWEITQGRKGG